MVETEESAEAVAPPHGGGRALRWCRMLQKPVVESLVCASKNVFQGVCRLRSGAGSIPWSPAFGQLVDQLVDVLLSRPGAAGVPLNTIATGSDTALRRAINSGRVDVVNLLIDSGADPQKEPYNANREAAGHKVMQTSDGSGEHHATTNKNQWITSDLATKLSRLRSHIQRRNEPAVTDPGVRMLALG